MERSYAGAAALDRLSASKPGPGRSGTTLREEARPPEKQTAARHAAADRIRSEILMATHARRGKQPPSLAGGLGDDSPPGGHDLTRPGAGQTSAGGEFGSVGGFGARVGLGAGGSGEQ